LLRIFISNAIKFTTKGNIKIIARYNNAANWLEVDVKDSGIGINQLDLPNLFMPFYQMSETKHLNKNGVGLNLFIAKLICKKLNGRVSVISKSGMGSKFSFCIEACNAEPVKTDQICFELGVISEEDDKQTESSGRADQLRYLRNRREIKQDREPKFKKFDSIESDTSSES